MATQAPKIFGITGKSGNYKAPDFWGLSTAGTTTSAGSAANTVSVGSISVSYTHLRAHET